MRIFFFILGCLAILSGLGSCVMGAGAGAIGAIGGAAFGGAQIGFGLLCIGISALIEELQRIRKALERGTPRGPAAPLQEAVQKVEPYREI